MHIEFNCSCGTRMRTTAGNAGKRAKCPNCGSLVAIPTQAEEIPVVMPVEQVASKSSTPAASGKPRVAARPVVAKPLSPPAPSFDPLDFGSVSSPAVYNPLQGSMHAPAWPQAAAPSRESHIKALVFATVGVVAVLVLIGLGVGIYKLASSGRGLAAKGPTAANSSASTASSNKSSSEGGLFGLGGSTSSGSSVAGAVNPPITQAESDQIAKDFSQAVRSMDRAACQRLFQFDITLDDIARDAKMSTKDRNDFKRGFNNRMDVIDQIHRALVTEGGEYVLLRSVTRDGAIRPILRLKANQSGLNYQELILARDAKGSPIIVDLYNYSSGETYGDTIRRLVFSLVAARDSTMMGRLTGRNRQMAEYAGALDKVNKLRNVNPRAALDELNRLPVDTQQDKTIMLVRLRLATEIDQNLANTIFEKFRQLYPNDPCVDLLSIDYHITRDQNPLAIEAIERLKQHVGGDPVLDEMIEVLR